MSNDLYLYTGDRFTHTVSIEYGDLFEFIDLDSILHIKSNTIISTNHISNIVKYTKKSLNNLITSINIILESLNNAFTVLDVYKNIILFISSSYYLSYHYYNSPMGSLYPFLYISI